jgi:hypothetical protein
MEMQMLDKIKKFLKAKWEKLKFVGKVKDFELKMSYNVKVKKKGGRYT